LSSASEDRDEAERWGNEVGAEWWGRMKGSGFWVGCMGNAGDYYSELKDWGAPRWAEMLRYLANEKGRGILLLGGEPERASLEALRESSGVGERVGVAVGDMEALRDVRRLLGLTSMAEGYIGRDTGPMHIAAALKRPVVAVFGAGMWPRFVPQVTPSYSMAVGVPCASCGWHCHLEESVCVKRVPVSEVMGAVDAILGRRENGAGVREARLLPMPVGLTIPQREDPGMHEQQSRKNTETMAQGGRTMDETRLDDSEVAAAMREVKQTLQQDITNLWRIVTDLRGGVEVNKAELDRAEAEKAANTAVVEQLRRDVASLNAAAIERERDFARRDESWNVRLLNATTQANASRLELAQVSDKLATAENTNRSLQSQIAHWESAHRSQLAIINEQQGNLTALQARVQELEAAMGEKTKAYEARIRELGAAGQQARARLEELANARSRRLLQKFGLVSRCQWEQS
jgi:peptidoglycan hydrolase CwlO-like protein